MLKSYFKNILILVNSCRGERERERERESRPGNDASSQASKHVPARPRDVGHRD